jgi:hypothetical protein
MTGRYRGGDLLFLLVIPLPDEPSLRSWNAFSAIPSRANSPASLHITGWHRSRVDGHGEPPSGRIGFPCPWWRCRWTSRRLRRARVGRRRSRWRGSTPAPSSGFSWRRSMEWARSRGAGQPADRVRDAHMHAHSHRGHDPPGRDARGLRRYHLSTGMGEGARRGQRLTIVPRNTRMTLSTPSDVAHRGRHSCHCTHRNQPGQLRRGPPAAIGEQRAQSVRA